MSWLDKYKEEKIFIQQENGHNKFWATRIESNNANEKVVIRWGRIGTKGQRQEVVFENKHEATYFIDKKLGDKKRKGYTNQLNGKEIDQQTFEKLSIEAAIVGTQNKCHNFEWVEIISENGDFVKINEERLFENDCNPGILVSIETKKKYDGDNNFLLLFTFDKCFKITGKGKIAISKTSELYKLTSKVEEAVGRSMS